MRSMNRNGKTYWLFDYAEMESVRAMIRKLPGNPLLRDGEEAFVEQMARLCGSGTFCISNPQLMWLDTIMRRCSLPGFGNGV